MGICLKWARELDGGWCAGTERNRWWAASVGIRSEYNRNFVREVANARYSLNIQTHFLPHPPIHPPTSIDLFHLIYTANFHWITIAVL